MKYPDMKNMFIVWLMRKNCSAIFDDLYVVCKFFVMQLSNSQE